VEGVAKVGETLTAKVTPTGATVNYQWMRCDTVDGTYTNIAGATSSTYTLVADDVGKYIKVAATGTGSYTGTVTSDATTAVESTPEPVPAEKLAFGQGSAVYQYAGAAATDGKVSFTFTDKSKFEALYEHGLGYGGKEFTHTDADGKATTETATWKYALVPFDVTEDIGDVTSIEVYSDADYTTKVGDVTYFDLTESHNVYRISAIRIAEKDSDQWKYLGDSTAYVLIELADGKQYTVEVAVSVTGAAAGDVLLDLTPEP
jgi:hypothetical protein